jgi:hypothetical protein
MAGNACGYGWVAFFPATGQAEQPKMPLPDQI